MNRITLTVDLNTIAENAKKIRKTIMPAKVMAVVKANAYGLGALPIVKRLIAEGFCDFAISSAQEALELRTHHPKIKIYQIGICFAKEVEELIKNQVAIGCSSEKMLSHIAKVAKKIGQPASIHWLIDTGMGRLGTPYDNWREEWQKISRLFAKNKQINLSGIYSHFSNSEKKNDAYSHLQIKKFKTLVQNFSPQEKSIKFHFCNSNAMINYPKQRFDMVRCGISIYGSNVCRDHPLIQTKRSYQLFSHIIDIRTLPKGHGVGYNHLHRLEKTSRVATISAGFADGIPMQLINQKAVIVRGEKVKVIGKVSMDYTTVLLPKNSKAKVGDKAIFLGASGKEEISIENWAKWKQTNVYEPLTILGRRVRRIYLPN